MGRDAEARPTAVRRGESAAICLSGIRRRLMSESRTHGAHWRMAPTTHRNVFRVRERDLTRKSPVDMAPDLMGQRAAPAMRGVRCARSADSRLTEGDCRPAVAVTGRPRVARRDSRVVHRFRKDGPRRLRYPRKAAPQARRRVVQKDVTVAPGRVICARQFARQL